MARRPHLGAIVMDQNWVMGGRELLIWLWIVEEGNSLKDAATGGRAPRSKEDIVLDLGTSWVGFHSRIDSFCCSSLSSRRSGRTFNTSKNPDASFFWFNFPPVLLFGLDFLFFFMCLLKSHMFLNFAIYIDNNWSWNCGYKKEFGKMSCLYTIDVGASIVVLYVLLIWTERIIGLSNCY